MKFLIIFSVIICGVAGATFISLAQQKHPNELNQQAYLEGRTNAFGNGTPVAALTPIDPAPQPIQPIDPPKLHKSESAGSIIGMMELLALVSLGLFFYFLPSIAGSSKRNAGAIFVLNLFTGWSFIGWVIALVWACTQDSLVGVQSNERSNP